MRSVIKLENTFIFIITIAVYVKLEFSIWLFLLLLLVPDIFMLGYVINRKTGSYVYNIGHTYITPIIIALLYLYIDERLLLQISLIWLAHIKAKHLFKADIVVILIVNSKYLKSLTSYYTLKFTYDIIIFVI